MVGMARRASCCGARNVVLYVLHVVARGVLALRLGVAADGTKVARTTGFALFLVHQTGVLATMCATFFFGCVLQLGTLCEGERRCKSPAGDSLTEWLSFSGNVHRNFGLQFCALVTCAPPDFHVNATRRHHHHVHLERFQQKVNCPWPLFL